MIGHKMRFEINSADTEYIAAPMALRQIRFDYPGLIQYSRKRGVPIPELSDEELNMFILNSDIATIRKIKAETGFG